MTMARATEILTEIGLYMQEMNIYSPERSAILAAIWAFEQENILESFCKWKSIPIGKLMSIYGCHNIRHFLLTGRPKFPRFPIFD